MSAGLVKKFPFRNDAANFLTSDTGLRSKKQWEGRTIGRFERLYWIKGLFESEDDCLINGKKDGPAIAAVVDLDV